MSDTKPEDVVPEHLKACDDLVTWKPSAITLREMRVEPETVVKFLARLSVTGNQSDACRWAKISRMTIHRLKDVPEFRDAFAAAMESAADTIDAEIYRRSMVGVKRSVFQGGKQVGVVREWSDPLLALRAKAMHPSYKDIGKSNVNVAAVAGATAGASSGPPVPPTERGEGMAEHELTLGEGIQKLLEVASANKILPDNMRVTRDEVPPDPDMVPDDMGEDDDE